MLQDIKNKSLAKTLEHNYTYALLQAPQEEKIKILNITQQLYTNKHLAEKWYNNIKGYLKSRNKSTILAKEKLDELYKGITNTNHA